jgi:hypothetical protein
MDRTAAQIQVNLSLLCSNSLKFQAQCTMYRYIGHLYRSVFHVDMQESVEYTLHHAHCAVFIYSLTFLVDEQENKECPLYTVQCTVFTYSLYFLWICIHVQCTYIQPCIPCGYAGECRVHTYQCAYTALYFLWICRRM